MRKLGLSFFFIIATLAGVNSQAIDTFNIMFKHDFEHNTLGHYKYEEWLEDWNYPTWANRQVPPSIEQNTDPENGSKVMRWHYPEGSLGPGEGGGQWFAELDNPCDELYFSFRMKFKPGFVWVLGGKMHGLIAQPFKGFEIPEWDEGAMVLLMWRKNEPIFYYYHQDQDHYYGNSEGWNYRLESGKWYTITIRMVMNTLNENGGNNDGILEGFIDGKLVCQMGNMRFRNLESIKINILEITSFFGGGDDSWRSQRDEWMDVDDFIAFTYTDAVDVPRGNTMSSSDRVLIMPGSDIILEDTIPNIKVNARGTQYNGEYAHFKVLVNKEFVGETFVTSSENTYTFYPDYPVSDDDTIYIVFDNDLFILGEADINLYVTSINVNNKTYYPNNNNVVFVYDLDVLEGNDIEYGSGFLGWDGKLVFFLGGDVVLDDVYQTLIDDDILFNDHPVLQDQTFNIVDSLIDGIIVGKIIADDDEKQTLKYALYSNDVNNTFAVLQTTGEIYVNNTSNLQNIDELVLTAKATDNACNNLCDSSQITINIEHIGAPVVDNNPPNIDNQNFNIYDNLPNSSVVDTVVATDPNITQQLNYSILSGNLSNAFMLDALKGILSVDNSAALESSSIFNLLVEVSDNGPENLSDTGLITINVEHFEPPVTFNNPPNINDQDFNIREEDNLANIVIEIIALDPDTNQNLTYSITSGNEQHIFDLNTSSGDLSISDTSKLNFQDMTEFSLNIKVQDDGEGFLTNSAILKINLIPRITTFYIDPTNINDQSEDGSVDHPYDSWSDITWKEGNKYLQKKGTTANESKINIYASNVTLGSYGEGDKPVINSLSSDFAFRAFEKYNLTIQDLKILANDAISCIYILGPSCDNNVIVNCHLDGADNGIRIIEGKTVIVKYNTFSNNIDAIYSYAETTKVYYNIFNGNGTGININSYLSSTEVYNNVFYNNSRGVSTSYSSLTIYNNIFYLADQGDQAINHKMDNLVSDNNIFYPEQDGFLDIDDKKYSSLYDYQQSMGLDLNSFTSDPMFKDIYNKNFGLEAGSPAIDAGKNVGILMDFYGYNVPFGGAPNIGLSELIDNQGVASSIFDNNSEENSPLIFPNPSDGNFKISFKDVDFQVSELQIKDMAGNLIFQDYLEYEGNDIFTDIDISHVSRGVYIVFLAIDDKIYSQRVIIN